MNQSNVAPMMALHVPDNPVYLARLGSISVRHGHLDHVLRLTIKTLTGVTQLEALDATKYEGSASLRKRINKLALQELGEGKPLIRLQALLTRCERATEKRNQLIHDICVKELDGDPKLKSEDHEWRGLPEIDDLQAIMSELAKLTYELNGARLNGFLFEALKGQDRR